MLLKEAEAKAATIVEMLSPGCEKIEVVGSIRRKKLECHDVDILLIPTNYLWVHAAILKMGPVKVDGPLLTRVDVNGVQVDFNWATSETWGTLELIRTGSTEHNIRLTTLAKRKGWKLAASGQGLLDGSGKRIAWQTEEEIFKALGLNFISPELRN